MSLIYHCFRTVAYWDLERFSQVGVSPVESNGVRCVLFHPDEEILFSASQDSLRVCRCTHLLCNPLLSRYITGNQPVSWITFPSRGERLTTLKCHKNSWLVLYLISLPASPHHMTQYNDCTGTMCGEEYYYKFVTHGSCQSCTGDHNHRPYIITCYNTSKVTVSVFAVRSVPFTDQCQCLVY